VKLVGNKAKMPLGPERAANHPIIKFPLPKNRHPVKAKAYDLARFNFYF
jgi:hypothetical protein